MKVAATFVDHPAARTVFAVLGILVASLFVLFGLDFLRVDPLAEPGSFSIGACALLGQIGWWGRVVLRSTTLHTHPALQLAVALLLCTGIVSVLYALAFMPKGPLALPLLLTLLGSGVLMLLGTVANVRAGA